MHKANCYASYLLRLWRDTDSGPWRATLVGQSGRVHSFADPIRLFAFLQTQMETMPAGEASARTDENPAHVEAGSEAIRRPGETVNA